MKTVNIAIDGPSGAGKSTISKFLAKALNYIYVDTGALYRAVGLFAYRKGISLKEISKICDFLSEISVDIQYVGDQQHVFLNGEDVSGLIRAPEISMYASAVSALPAVRGALLDLQKGMARRHNIIMDGRDIGTVVLPHADLKIFLTASAEERAKRRYDELLLKGSNVSYEDVLKDMKTRDANDSQRDTAPLKPADDAHIIDTTGNTLEQSAQFILNFIREKQDVL